MKPQTLGLQLMEWRKSKGLTQEELAEKSNINVRTIQRIEAGVVEPRSYTLKTILTALDKDHDALSHKTDDTLHPANGALPESNVMTKKMKDLMGKWSFLVYILLLLVFGLMISYDIPWYYYLLPIVIIFFIEVGEIELESNL